MWRAYFAMPDTMDDAILLGSLHMGVVTMLPERKEAFLSLMRDVVADLIEEQIGVRPTNRPES